ncbi:MAG: sugar ABC transporter permease [Anaerolineales bacterium]|nr:sugar ABC transporter permease [Anaerolineales bacterium]
MDLPVSKSSKLTASQGIFSGRRLRQLREYITAYLMIAPAVILIFVFGIFPVGFALYVSLNKWRLKRSGLIGLDNYTKSIGNLIYVALFALALGALAGAIILLIRTIRLAREKGDKPWLLAIPGALHAAAVAAFFQYIFYQLPEFLDIANKIVGKQKTRELFNTLLSEAFRAETVQPAWQLFFWLFIAAIVVSVAAYFLWRNLNNPLYQANFALVWLLAIISVGLSIYTYNAIQSAYAVALEEGSDPGIWPQLLTISVGAILLAFAWWLWDNAEKAASTFSFWLRLVAALILMVGGWALIGQLPMVIANSDPDLWTGLKVTVFYSLGTVPFQLSIALFISVLLFQRLRGSEIMRVIYFLPYVTPAVASAAIYKQLFSNRPQAPVNQLLGLFGIGTQQWLREPRGIFAMIAQGIGIENLPEWLGGPSMALVVIMIFSIWTFVGYNTVIYLAGLGNISNELLEAAEIDGANRWQIFSNIIFPLLSPTTYFLSLISIIGTFKAFNHIWVMRDGLALGTTDTFSVMIFIEFFEKLRYGYASALAFVLFAIILGLTYINNRVQGSRVFYG